VKIHEDQAKALFSQYGIPASQGIIAATPGEARRAAEAIGGGLWVVKAQVHTGGRGKAGGVKLAHTAEEAEAFAAKWLGKRLVTFQSGPEGALVDKILVAAGAVVRKEY
jgi:succinyl-CoA synthetase beta subunit